MRYLETGNSEVNGWLWPTTALMIATLLAEQTAACLAGDVLEIGVHHGKLLILLATCCGPGETATAVDVFGEQTKNLDGSGQGDRAVFEANVQTYAAAASVEILQASSLDLEAAGFLARRFRFVSIDGGHTAAVTQNDLRIAERTLLDGGIVALDDVMNPQWTGVLTGLVGYSAAGGTLQPFAHIPNKLLLTTPGHGGRYRALLRAGFDLALLKSQLEFLGGEVDSYREHDQYDLAIAAGLRRDLAASVDDRNRLQGQLQAAQTEQARLKQDNAQLTAQAAAAVARETQAVQERDQFRQLLIAAQGERSQMCDERDGYRAQLIAAQGERSQMGEERDDFRALLAVAQAERSQMCDERDAFRALLAATQEARTQMGLERDQARQHLAELVGRNAQQPTRSEVSLARLAAMTAGRDAAAAGLMQAAEAASRLWVSTIWRAGAPIRGGVDFVRNRLRRPG